MKKILVIQLRRIGDVLATIPVLSEIAHNFIDAKIDFLVEKPSDELVRLNPYVNEVLVYDKKDALKWILEIRRRKYDWVIDYHSNGRTAFLTALSGAPKKIAFAKRNNRKLFYNHLVKINTNQYIVAQKLELLSKIGLNLEISSHFNWGLNIPKQAENWANKFLKDHKIDEINDFNLIGMAPCSRRESRCWIPEYFAEVLDYLGTVGKKVILFFSENERPYINSILDNVKNKEHIILLPKVDLVKLYALISKCSLFVSPDNGPRHFAISANVPTITMVGPTSPVAITPNLNVKNNIVFRNNGLSCIQCEGQVCEKNDHECMRSIKPKMVIEQIRFFTSAEKSGGK